MPRLLVVALLSLPTFLTPPAFGQQSEPQTVSVSSREALLRAVRNATPGTRISIAPGTYHGGLSFEKLQGKPENPIVLTASDPAEPPIFTGGGTGMQLSDPSYVELHHLVFSGASGNGLNIDDGGSYETPAHHLVLHDITVRDVGPAGNRDGMKLSGVDEITIRQCTIERWGDSGSAIDMVGCHRSEIDGCTFRFRSDLAANGVQTKGGSSQILIRRCRFENAGSRAVNIGGSTGLDYFRPRDARFEAKEITVEDCTFIGSLAPIAFVGVDGARVHHNTIYRPERWVVRILQETTGPRFVPCRNGEFTNNLIAFRADELLSAVNVGPDTKPESFRFAENHWYCLDQPSRSDEIQLPVAEIDSHHGIDPEFVDEAQHDLRLEPDSPVTDAGVRR